MFTSSLGWILFWGLGILTALSIIFRMMAHSVLDGEFEKSFINNDFLRYIFDLLKDVISPLEAVMLPYVMLGVAFRTHKFAQEGFHDMFSISINMFVPCDTNREGYVLAVRTLKEVPLQHVFYDEGAMDSLKSAAEYSLNNKDPAPRVSSSRAFQFVDMRNTPDPHQTVTRFREFCSSKLSDIFSIYQTLSAMRVGPIVTRRFCWAVTYEADIMPSDSKRKLMRSLSSVSTRNLFSSADVKVPSTTPKHGDHSASNKFRLIMIELDCLRQSHLKAPEEMQYETKSIYFMRRWATIREMRSLFDLESGRPRDGSTILCGSVVFSAPLMTMVDNQDQIQQQSWSFAPWEAWGQSGQ